MLSPSIILLPLVYALSALIVFWIIRLAVRFALRDHTRWLEARTGDELDVGPNVL